MIADPDATRRKVRAAHAAGVPANTGGGPYEVAVAQGQFGAYLDLCADVGFDGIECGAGFTDPGISPAEVVRLASESTGWAWNTSSVRSTTGSSRRTRFDAAHRGGSLMAGGGRPHADHRGAGKCRGRRAVRSVGESERRAGGAIRRRLFGLSRLIFEAPTKSSQFALLDHFGPQVQLSNVPLGELLRVEIYRRGLHSDAFANPQAPRPRCRPQRTDRVPATVAIARYPSLGEMPTRTGPSWAST